MSRMLLSAAALLTLACAGGKADDVDSEAGSDLYAGSSCQQLMACYVSVSQDDFAATVGTYGPDSACWSDAALANGCEGACDDLLYSALDRWPNEPECGGEPIEPGAFPFDDGAYDIDIDTVLQDSCGNMESQEQVEYVESSMNSVGSFEIEYGVFPAFEMGIYDCTVSGMDFTCATIQGQASVDGTFQGRQTAEVVVDVVDSSCVLSFDGQLTRR